MKEEICIR